MPATFAVAFVLLIQLSAAEALTIIDVKAKNLTHTAVLISWTTSSMADSKVHYREIMDKLFMMMYNPMPTRNHEVTIQDLLPGHVYYFNVSSCDSSCSMEGTFIFSTIPADCIESWSCNDWSPCNDGLETRVCTDSSQCGTSEAKPLEIRTCGPGPGGTQCQPGEVRACGSSVGECNPGTMTCTNGAWSQCSGNIQPKDEVCGDLKDNDCDGEVDEDYCTCIHGSVKTCGSDIGECVPGLQRCLSGRWGECMGNIPATAEICNGLDDDCDGETDDNCVVKERILDLCNNGIMDGHEEGIDCGGICPLRCFETPGAEVSFGAQALMLLVVFIVIAIGTFLVYYFFSSDMGI